MCGSGGRTGAPWSLARGLALRGWSSDLGSRTVEQHAPAGKQRVENTGFVIRLQEGKLVESKFVCL